jgi:hypothetical protein
MADKADVTFLHGPHTDGLIDSVCSWCFATVATKTNDDDLREAESRHTCNGLELAAKLRFKGRE